MKTFMPQPKDIDRSWFVVDASEKILGRLASQIAHRLRGKHKPEFVPYLDNGDFIVVVNAGKVKVTGAKLTDKMYYWHTGYIGGIKSKTLGQVMATRPEEAIIRAVKGMLPKNRLGRAMLKKLKVYAGPDHPHVAQKPQPLELIQ